MGRSLIVLDASAILAAMVDEAGGEKVKRVLDMSVVCAVNAAEVIGKLVDKGFPPAWPAALSGTSSWRRSPSTRSLAVSAALLRDKTGSTASRSATAPASRLPSGRGQQR